LRKRPSQGWWNNGARLKAAIGGRDSQRKGIEMDSRIGVLVVEDEPLIRMAIISELEDAGFEVFEAPNADAAIVALILNSSIQIVFTDVDMPGGNDGLKLAAAIRDGWPPIRIIVTSGHQKVAALAGSIDGHFIAKPYNTANVIETINEILAA
jgi:two-component system, response regulator PdtaR